MSRESLSETTEQTKRGISLPGSPNKSTPRSHRRGRTASRSISPDDALCFVGGLTPIPLWQLVLIAVIGRSPAFFLVNVFGHLVANGDVYEAMVLLALIVGLSILGYLNRGQIPRFLARRVPRHPPRRP